MFFSVWDKHHRCDIRITLAPVTVQCRALLTQSYRRENCRLPRDAEMLNNYVHHNFTLSTSLSAERFTKVQFHALLKCQDNLSVRTTIVRRWRWIFIVVMNSRLTALISIGTIRFIIQSAEETKEYIFKTLFLLVMEIATKGVKRKTIFSRTNPSSFFFFFFTARLYHAGPFLLVLFPIFLKSCDKQPVFNAINCTFAQVLCGKQLLPFRNWIML